MNFNLINQKGKSWSNADALILSLAFRMISKLSEHEIDGIFTEEKNGQLFLDELAKKNFYHVFSQIDYDRERLQENDLMLIEWLKDKFNELNEKDRKQLEENNHKETEEKVDWNKILKKASIAKKK